MATIIAIMSAKRYPCPAERAFGFSDLPRSSGPVGLADLLALDLAGRAAGELVDELDAARDLEAGQVLAGELDDVGGELRRARVAGVQRHHRLHLLAPLVVGRP